MENKYLPEEEIPDRFWKFISSISGDVDKIRNELIKMHKDDVLSFFGIFLDAKTEMNDVIATRFEDMEITEDTIDDLSDAFITKGKNTYLSIYYGRSELPPREMWENFETIGYLFSQIYYERFDENIYDKVDE